jgi:hypothetical protein
VVPERVQDWWRHRIRAGVCRLPIWFIFASLLIACYGLASVLLRGDLAFGLPGGGDAKDASNLYAAAAGGLMGLTLFALFGARLARTTGVTRMTVSSDPDSGTRLLAVMLYVLLVAVLMSVSLHFYNQFEHPYGPVWLEIADAALGRPLALLTLFCAVILSCAFAFRHPALQVWPRCFEAMRGLTPFLAAGAAAYVIAFALAPAYIFTGYRYRLAPFTVFHTNVLPTLATYAAVCAVGYGLFSRDGLETSAGRTTSESRRAEDEQSSLTVARAAGLRWLSVGVVTALCIYWIGMQVTYFRALPPLHYAFLRLLGEPPFRGASFVVTGYAGPIAASTQNWAYLDVNLLRNELVIEGGSNELALDTRYLWFADKLSNPSYRKPDYFICIASQTLNSMAEAASRRAGNLTTSSGCEQHQLVRIARGFDPSAFDPKPSLAAFDVEGPAAVGYERWAIVKLYWKCAAGRP